MIILILSHSTLFLVLLLVCLNLRLSFFGSLVSGRSVYLIHSFFNLGHLRIEIKDALLLFLSACHWVGTHSTLDKVFADKLHHLALRGVPLVEQVEVIRAGILD